MNSRSCSIPSLTINHYQGIYVRMRVWCRAYSLCREMFHTGNLRSPNGAFFTVLEDEGWRSHDPSNVCCGACIITMYRTNFVLLHIVQNECEQVFSATHTTDAKSLTMSCSVVRMRSERSLFALALPDSKLLKFGRSISAL